MSVSKIRLRTLADAGNKRASQVLDVTENHTSKMLSAILIGNNIVNLSASALATSLAYTFGGYMVSIATAVLTIAILVFGEITPKNYATINAEKLALRYIPVIRFIMTVMTPVIFIINLFSRGIMLLLRVDPDVIPVIAVLRKLYSILPKMNLKIPGFQGFSELGNLVSRVVDVKLFGNVVTGAVHSRRQAVAQRSAPGVAHMHGTGGVGGDAFNHHLFVFAVIAVAVIFALTADGFDYAGEPAVLEEKVDESGTGNLEPVKKAVFQRD